MKLEAIATEAHLTAREKGFWDGDVSFDKLGLKLALIHSEVTELLEALRKSKGVAETESEVADVIIRLADLWVALKSAGYVRQNLDDVVQLKLAKNAGRPRLHGNRFG